MDKIRKKLIERKTKGILEMGRSFDIADKDKSKQIDREEFFRILQLYQLNFNEEEQEIAFNAFNIDGQGGIRYEEFLRVVRGNLSPAREKLIMQAFGKMDKDNSGVIDYKDLLGVYNAKQHPKVVAGEKTEEQALNSWLQNFEIHHTNYTGGQCDSQITKEEWLEYYKNVSMFIDDDAYFEVMMNNAWRMNEHTTYNNEKKGWSG